MIENDNAANNDGEAGVFLGLSECGSLYVRLKENEPILSAGERLVLFRIEQVLYKNFSIQEIEELLDKVPVKAGSQKTRSM